MGAIAVSKKEEEQIERLRKDLGIASKSALIRAALKTLEKKSQEEKLRRDIQDSVNRCGAADRLFLFGSDLAPRLIFHVLDAGRKQRAAVNAGQQPLLAEVIEILADGLGRDLEPPRQILHHHPPRGAGEVQDFGLAVSEPGHGIALARGGRAKTTGGSVAGSNAKIG